MKVILFILSLIYDFFSKVRNFLFDKQILKTYKSSIPVICVGNLTVGGNGKTPLCILLAKKYAHLNPVILSRGYRAKNSGVIVVNDSHTATEVGDEAKMIFDAGFLVVIAPSRISGAKWIEKHKLGKLIILDDGFQHRYLERDLNLVLIDCSSRKAVFNFKLGHLLPLGRFRESKRTGFGRADAVILSSRSKSEVKVKSEDLGIPSNIPVFHSKIIKTKIFPTIDKTKSFVAVCAIANPTGFFKVLGELDLNILEYYTKGDHYSFTKNDIEKIKARFPDAEIICTEKDAVKLRPLINVYSLQIEVDLTPIEEFDTLVQSHLNLPL